MASCLFDVVERPIIYHLRSVLLRFGFYHPANPGVVSSLTTGKVVSILIIIYLWHVYKNSDRDNNEHL